MACALLAIGFSANSYGQGASSSNPLEYTVIQKGEAELNSHITSQTRNLEELASVQGTMVGEATLMKKWEKQYNAYLTTAQGYAEKIALASTLFQDGMQTLTHLWELDLARRINPEGTFATMSMNNLYMETTTEMLSVFTLLKNAVAQGGSENMLTGSDRSKTLWELEDRLSAFSHKLQLLYYSIRHYRMSDVWNRATAGMIERDRRDVALQSLSHWKRRAREVSLY